MLYASPKTIIVRSDDGVAKALYLEGAFIGQHQCGIAEMQQELGIGNEEIDGLERFTVKVRQGMVWNRPLFRTFEQKVHSWANGRRKTVKVLALAILEPEWRPDHRSALFNDTDDILGEFNRENAVVFARSKEAKDFLNVIARHAAEGDVAVYWHNGSRNPFARGGLMISIPSLIEQRFLDDIREIHMREKVLTRPPLQLASADRAWCSDQTKPSTAI